VSVLLAVRGLRVEYPVRAGWLARRRLTVKAVDGVDLELGPGETLGLVGESGCGKSTLGSAVLGIVRPTGGAVVFEGTDLAGLDAEGLRRARRQMQMIFQDPYGSLNPRMRVGESVGEPLLVHGLARGPALRTRVGELLELVGLEAGHADRYPHEFSGGQRQRVGIARALALEPKLVVCDEPVSALDVSVRSQVLNLLADLQRRLGVAYLFISHDLSVVRHVSDRVAVMYLGRVVELAPRDVLFARPLHPYTEALMSAIPVPDPRRQRAREQIVLRGELPRPTEPPAGCAFHTRCPLAIDICRNVAPTLEEKTPGRRVACHLRGPASQS
jgi:oligopeptide/dipeptide ABC transporter ATP-binding protein